MSKRFQNVKACIPYVDHNGMRNMVVLSFYGDVAERRVRREIRKYIKGFMGRCVSKEWIEKNVTLITSPITGLSAEVVVTDDMVEDWISRIEDKDEDTDQGHTDGQGCSVEEAGREMSSVQDQDQSSNGLSGSLPCNGTDQGSSLPKL